MNLKEMAELGCEESEEKLYDTYSVVPSFLTHPYAQVVCTNKGELNYVLEWAKQNGKEINQHYYNVEKFRFHLFLAGEIVGWTDSTNRIGEKFSFREFVDSINWV